VRLLHLVPDDKFIEFAAELLESLDGVESRFVARLSDPAAPTRHLGRVKLWRKVGRGYFFSAAMRADLAWCDALVVHYVDVYGAWMMLRAPARVAVVWSGWGADYHELLSPGQRAYLGPRTAALVRELRGPTHGLPGAARNAVARPLLAAALARTQVFSAPIAEDFELLQGERGARFRARFAQFNYGSVERTFSPGAEGVRGGDILVGNSAAPTNNHAEAFELLASRDLGERRVVVPLTYGDPAYREAVVALGRRMFGRRFEPILEHLPLAAYNEVVSRCAVGVMHHRRQQALGTVGGLLYRGARVFLDESAVLHRFLKRHGVEVFPSGSLGAGSLEPLSADQRAGNRAAIEALWSHDAVTRNAERFRDAIAQCAGAAA
jgi:dTDP-N-acetylfucosamine:lipid II N-acetylfucosaminyltransferase